ncbi:MAG: HAD family hydrolase [Ignavibacteriaceae bacterium]
MIEHIIWDWNGTLFNDVQLCVELGNELLISRGLPEMSYEHYREIFTLPVIRYYEKAGFDFSKESFEKLGRVWMDRYEARKYECDLFEDVKNVLRTISDRGISQYVLSAYSQNDLVQIIDRYGISEYFRNIKGLHHIYADSKLHLGVELLEEIDTHPDHILIVGDTHHDFEIAKELGVKAVLFSRGHQTGKILKEFGVPVIDKHTELLNYL